jgi:hypothetical protein
MDGLQPAIDPARALLAILHFAQPLNCTGKKGGFGKKQA